MTKVDEVNEVTLWRGRPSFWNWWAELLLGDLFLLLAGALWWISEPFYAPWSLAAGLAVYLIVLVIRFGDLYLVTSQRVIAQSGLLSRRVDEIEIQDIRNITLEQSFFQRILGVGDIGISSAGGEGIEVRFDGVGGAADVKERVRLIRIHRGKPPADGDQAGQIALPGLAEPGGE